MSKHDDPAVHGPFKKSLAQGLEEDELWASRREPEEPPLPEEPEGLRDAERYLFRRRGRRPDNGHEVAGGVLSGPAPELPLELPAVDVPPGDWLETYVRHADAISPMTPTEFHEAAGLWLGGVAIARRLVLAMPYGEVFPNLWALWVAPTTLWRKSTGLDVARHLALDAVPHLLAAQDTTPEALLSDMAGKEPAGWEEMPDEELALWRRERAFCAQRGLLLDELSGLLAGAGRDYNAGLVEAFLRFYDGERRFTRSTRGQGRVVVKHACLSILGASTPSAMLPHLGAERLWANGWWPRFALLAPPEGRPDWRRAQGTERPAELAEGLVALHRRLGEPEWPDPPKALAVELGPGVYDAWEVYNKALSYDLLLGDDVDGRLWGTYGRLPTQALKVAVILAALDWPNGQRVPIVTMPHLTRALYVAEGWRRSAHRVLAVMEDAQGEGVSERVLRYVARAGEHGVTLRDLYRGLHLPVAEAEGHVQDLMHTGEIEALEEGEGRANGGRRTMRYRMVARPGA